MAMRYELTCTSCGLRANDPASRCKKCASILEVRYDYSTMKLGRGFKRQRITHKKYAEFFPIKGKLFSIGEGGTTLKKARFGNCTLFMKLETENPTDSFKDRGSTVDITKAMELGFDSVCCASTGNMGLSVATYAKKAGLGCTIFISTDANKEKKDRIRKTGARLQNVNGLFNTALAECERFARESNAFLCGDYHYRKEGQKSIVMEIIEQMKYKVPDYLFIQVGNATLLAGTYKALLEFRRFGLIRKLPRIIAVQAVECDPFVRAYEKNKPVAYAEPKTYADAIAVGYPTFGFEGIKALDETHGFAISVKDKEIEEARMELFDKYGVKSEPGGAVGYAGLSKLYKKKPGTFKNKSVVVVVTGNNERWPRRV
jgi:threonine synthase